ncbi:unnamed protein product, partial [Durusdinium trenchii]
GEDGSVEESLAVPVGRIGHLIGKGGKNIQDLEKLTGARLRVLPAANDEEDEQRLLVSGTPKAVDLAKKHLRKYIPTLPDEVTASGVPERRKTETAAEPPAEPSPGESLRGRRAQAAEVLEAAGRARNSLKEVARSRSSSTSSRTRVKRLRERKKGISLEEYQVMLRKQKELDAAAAKAEEMAESARAFARRVAEEDRQREEVWDDDLKGMRMEISEVRRLRVEGLGHFLKTFDADVVTDLITKPRITPDDLTAAKTAFAGGRPR